MPHTKFDRRVGETPVALSGFNNLTKVLSFNLYDFCITFDEDGNSQKQKDEYIEFINRKYSGQKILEVSEKICEIIGANILAVSKQDYDPVGASGMVLMSDIKGGKWESSQLSLHLDKSHITAHTYPDAGDPNGICSFRVDIDIATCGDIIPLDAINYLFEAFECDVVYIDYVVRGYTRTDEGKKIYNDRSFTSIQDFIKPEILKDYRYRSDINMPQENIWQTKLFINDFPPSRYVMHQRDVNHPDVERKMKLLYEEMREVYHMIH